MCVSFSFAWCQTIYMWYCMSNDRWNKRSIRLCVAFGKQQRNSVEYIILRPLIPNRIRGQTKNNPRLFLLKSHFGAIFFCLHANFFHNFCIHLYSAGSVPGIVTNKIKSWKMRTNEKHAPHPERGHTALIDSWISHTGSNHRLLRPRQKSLAFLLYHPLHRLCLHLSTR